MPYQQLKYGSQGVYQIFLGGHAPRHPCVKEILSPPMLLQYPWIYWETGSSVVQRGEKMNVPERKSCVGAVFPQWHELSHSCTAWGESRADLVLGRWVERDCLLLPDGGEEEGSSVREKEEEEQRKEESVFKERMDYLRGRCINSPPWQDSNFPWLHLQENY